ncbi:hypothetical protein KY092_17950 [Natronomonas gomsonensis]|uniref:hypothetical protein n=1 Tax=Natronomonas gomsonensis TaxID=1046043 RepID=UPI0020CA8514|nr:hypothetical protein [Natronomonas gomsonensis]MCY4732436.1 hypothetical protein [Natronomonas gomsonensis]
MRIETYTCPDCGTVIAGNVLLVERAITCPGLDCDRVHEFADLPEDTQGHYEENRDAYQMD